MSLLRDLDDRVVPAAAARLQAFLVGVRRAADGLAPLRGPLVRRPARQGTWLDKAGALDDRFGETWAETGVLAVLRSYPQVVGVAIALSLVSALLYALTRQAPTVGQTGDAGAGSQTAYVGPQVGDKVVPYIASRDKELAARAASRPDGVVYAVVSFSGYRTPEAAADLIGALPLARVFFRVHVTTSPTEINQAAAVDLVRDTRKAYLEAADIRTKAAGEFSKLATTIKPRTKAERTFQRFYLDSATASLAEAAALRRDCACVFAVVVHAKLRELLALSTVADVRLVDVGPPLLTLDSLGFRGLLPEETVVVDNGGRGHLVLPR